MEKSVNCANDKMPVIGLSLLYGIKFFEGFAYWGLRMLMVLFLVNATENGGVGLEQSEALAIYVLFTLVVYLTPLIGAPVADFLLSPRTVAIMGGGVISIGLLSLSITNGGLFLESLLMIAVGAGLFKPCQQAMIAQLMIDRPDKVDGVYTFQELVINIAAFTPPLLLISLFGEEDYHSHFLFLAGVAFCIVLLLSWGGRWLDRATNNTKVLNSATKSISGLWIVLSLIGLSVCYWLIPDLTLEFIQAVTNKVTQIMQQSTDGQFGWLMEMIAQYLKLFSAGLLIVGLLVFSILWFGVRLNSWLKLSIGLFLYALSWLLYGYIFDANSTHQLFTILVTAEILFVLSELFFSPIVSSLVAQYSPRKLFTTSFALFTVTGLIFQHSNKLFGVYDQNQLPAIVAVTVIVAFITLALYIIKHKPKTVSIVDITANRRS